MKPTKRFLRILTLFAALCCLTLGKLAKGEEYAPFSGQELDAEAPRFQDGVKRGVLTYPFETYYGDSLYILSYRVNESGETIRNFQKERIVGHNPHFYEVTITSKDIDLPYEWAFERQSVYAGDVKYAFMPGNFEPGVRETGFYTALDFPPLEDWNDPFWKELREKMTPEGVKCTLSFRLAIGHTLPLEDAIRFIKLSQEIVIKPRPNDELALLEEWYNNTPKDLFPVRKTPYKIPSRGNVIPNNEESHIKVGDKSFSPWRLIRIGNRKPSDPNNPTTLEGWRELEAQLSPSTMRDEIRLTRLLLEFYAANDEESTEYWKSELMNWLTSLPESQSKIYVHFACDHISGIKNEGGEWKTKSLKLLSDLLTIAGDGTKLAYWSYYKELANSSR